METKTITELLQRVAVVDERLVRIEQGEILLWVNRPSYIEKGFWVNVEDKNIWPHVVESRLPDIFFAICERCQERGWNHHAGTNYLNPGWLYSFTIESDNPPAVFHTQTSRTHAALLAYLAACESVMVDCPECLDGAVVVGPDGHGLEIEPCKHCNGAGKVMPEKNMDRKYGSQPEDYKNF